MKVKNLIKAINIAIITKNKVHEKLLWTKILKKSLKHKKTVSVV